MALPISGLLAFCCCWGPLLRAEPAGPAVWQTGRTCTVVCPPQQTAAATSPRCTPRTIVTTDPADGAYVQLRSGGTTASSPVIVFAQAGDDDVNVLTSPAKEPSVWIGVRMTPVPEPLAAHIDGKGAMIANIVKGSPADEAGLQRYDVVIAFDGQKIDDPEDLGSAVAGAKPGHSAEMTVIRRTAKEKVTITPVERRATDKWEYKYEEPEADVIDRSLNLRGHRLLLSPGGAWTMEDLGPMHQMPDMLKHLKELHLQGLSPDVDVKIDELPDVPDADAGTSNARVEIRIQVDEDGQVTTIQRDADGKIQVEKTDADGKKSSESYDNAGEFEQGDPDAYKLYQRNTGHGGFGWTTVSPRAGQLQKLQHKFQIEIEQKTKAAMERAKAAQDKAHSAMEEAHRQYEITVQKHAAGGADAAATGESLSVQVDEDGQITVTTTKDGRKTIHKFDSKDEFKSGQPELYEKVKELLE